MLQYNPKRSSRLITIISEWRKKIQCEIDDYNGKNLNKNNAECIFSFLLRDPLDNYLHMCVDPDTLKIKDSALRDFWNKKVNKKILIDYIESKRKNDPHFEFIKRELEDRNISDKDFTIAFLAFIHAFPYPITKSNESHERKEYTCVDDCLYFLERFGKYEIKEIEDVVLLDFRKRFQLPGLTKRKIFTQNPLKSINTGTAPEKFLDIIKNIVKQPDYGTREYGLFIPVRNGNKINRGAILGFINFVCNDRKLRKYVKKYIQKNLDFIQFQISNAFFEGNLFEIVQGLGDVTNENLFDLATKNIRKIFSTQEIAEGKALKIYINYEDDFPYEYRQTILPLEEFKGKENQSLAYCMCPCKEISDRECEDGCIDYQKSKILKFIISLSEIKDQQAKIKDETIKHGTRAAVAAIMARNMSHNLGSHILSYLSSESQSDGKFYRYLQGRMDFIADISTRKPSWSSTVSFVEDIINPFIGPFVESSSKPFISPVTNAKIINNILRSIAINEGNERICLDAKKINIIVNIAVDDSNDKESPCQIVYSKHLNQYFYDKPDDFRDISLDIPHGSVGMHAFYSVLENFLRNSAKYGGDGINEILREKNKQFECYIDIESHDKSLYKVTIRDNLKKEKPFEVKNKIDSYIIGKDSRLIDNDGVINSEGWGIKEMRISAAWLRGIDPKEIQNSSLEPPILTTIITKNNELGYEFYLLKPLEALIVTDDSSIEAKPDEGIYVKKTAEELSDMIKNNALRHKCVVFDNPVDEIKEWIKKNILSLPSATFCTVSLKNCSTFIYIIDRSTYCNGNIKNNLYAELRKNVVNKYYAKEEVKLCVFEDTLRTICEEKNVSAITHLNDISSKCIVFNHDYKEKDSSELKQIYNNNPVFYQLYSSIDTTGRRIRELLKREGTCGIDKIYIGALSRIVFADERLFSKMQTMSENEYMYKKWERMGVEYIDIKRDSDKVIVYESGQKEPTDWNRYIAQKNRQITFFSIHQSTIKDVITEKLWKEMMVDDLNKNNIFITIHTGRAAINITSGFKYLEFSNIENILDNYDKLRLAELFFHEVRGSEELECQKK